MEGGGLPPPRRDVGIAPYKDKGEIADQVRNDGKFDYCFNKLDKVPWQTVCRPYISHRFKCGASGKPRPTMF